MKRRRPTKAETELKWEADCARVWGDAEFRPKLAAAKSFSEARLLVNAAVHVDRPGRGYYSNLGAFLDDFIPPARSSYEEKALYLQLFQRMDAAGQLKPGVGKQVEQALREAMEKQGEY